MEVYVREQDYIKIIDTLSLLDTEDHTHVSLCKTQDRNIYYDYTDSDKIVVLCICDDEIVTKELYESLCNRLSQPKHSGMLKKGSCPFYIYALIKH